jgi:hypothetical protein
MISTYNEPLSTASCDADFTVERYRSLLGVAKQKYRVAFYDDIPWGSKFLLWRHDLDYSINRAAALAEIEAEEGIRATYFVNPGSEFYNPFEPTQARLLKHILGLGHRLGLHFDASLHDVQNERILDEKIAQERRWLEDALGTPDAFSFHNPMASHLVYDAESYGGLQNCYSRRFKAEVGYCSDSNGYWRFRRLHDVLSDATDPCLQVLTHPGWWQAEPMPPRQRIFRSAFGRALATMRQYDAQMAEHRRVNHGGVLDDLKCLESVDPERIFLLDFLWNQGYLDSLFLELWRLHMPSSNQMWVEDEAYRHWARVYDQLVHGQRDLPREELQAGFGHIQRKRKREKAERNLAHAS